MEVEAKLLLGVSTTYGCGCRQTIFSRHTEPQGETDAVCSDGCVWSNFVSECRVALFGAAEGGEDVVATVGWHAGSLEHLHGVLSGFVACRLRLCNVHFEEKRRTANHFPGGPVTPRLREPANRIVGLLAQLSSFD